MYIRPSEVQAVVYTDAVMQLLAFVCMYTHTYVCMYMYVCMNVCILRLQVYIYVVYQARIDLDPCRCPRTAHGIVSIYVRSL